MLEKAIIYGVVIAVCLGIVVIYLRKLKKASDEVEAKVKQAKADGTHEPVSLYPKIDVGTCISSGACVEACPEKDILGIVNGKGTLINASNCVGHGACFHACPVEAISLVIGTEKRGVDLPHVSQEYETNVPGIYIAGELGGMGLIKNSVEQGQAAVENIARQLKKSKAAADLDLVIIGAGPAGISGSLAAKKAGLKAITLEQETLGGTVFTFPRSKVVMTSPMDLPLHGKVQLYDTSKSELLDLWNKVISENDITIKEKTKVESVTPQAGGIFLVQTNKGESFTTKAVLLAIGRRGTPRKLGVPGEMSEKVAYRLLEPELINDKKIVVVGGGDSAVESAMLLADQNEVILSYRKDAFSRIKPKNKKKIEAAVDSGQLKVLFETNLLSISPEEVNIRYDKEDKVETIPNDQVYIFAGGELPSKFLANMGIQITKRFGYTMKKHK